LVVDEYWWELEGWSSDLAPYVIMVRAFVEGRLTATEFENLYLVVFKRDPIQRPGEVFRILDRLFADVDSYHPDARIREQTEGIDEDELRARAAEALSGLADCR